jgi:hypothetical protein
MFSIKAIMYWCLLLDGLLLSLFDPQGGDSMSLKSIDELLLN